ncbi:MAG: hypothetical protein ACI9XZ_002600 [Alphaproteobacteria bacterium]|jgi:hypothetical protein
MSQLDLGERELAIGAAVAMDMAREDRKDNKEYQSSHLSGAASALTIAFVVIMSVGTLALMMFNRS